jgi:hypothetical protein
MVRAVLDMFPGSTIVRVTKIKPKEEKDGQCENQ